MGKAVHSNEKYKETRYRSKNMLYSISTLILRNLHSKNDIFHSQGVHLSQRYPENFQLGKNTLRTFLRNIRLGESSSIVWRRLQNPRKWRRISIKGIKANKRTALMAYNLKLIEDDNLNLLTPVLNIINESGDIPQDCTRRTLFTLKVLLQSRRPEKECLYIAYWPWWSIW